MKSIKSIRETKNTAILLIHCPDRQGILATVTEFLNRNNGNIIYLDQHIDTVENLIHKGRDLEKIVLSQAVYKHLQRKVLVFKNRTVVFN